VNEARVRVVLADDQEMVRAGLRMLVDFQPDLEVVGEAADGLEAVEVVARLRPDVVLMDVRMPVLDGIQATREIVALDDPPVRVLMLTTFDLGDYLLEALDAGVSGFTLKDTPPDELVAGLVAVARDDALVEPATTVRLIERGARHHPAAPGPELTAEERVLLDLIASGLANAEIAPRLGVTEAALGEAVPALLAKLGVRDRVHAVLLAHR
jgi:DNA-binding NarL/FixJ family response regulator